MVTMRAASGAMAWASASMRCGASMITTAFASVCSTATAWSRSPALLGKKPANTKPESPDMPAALSAVVTLLAPGSGITPKPALRTAATSRAPGSLTAGVPASLTYATRSPRCKRSTTPTAASSSLCSCTASKVLSIPNWRNRPWVWRVSSQPIASASCNKCSALRLMSARLPIGVATTYSVPCG